MNMRPGKVLFIFITICLDAIGLGILIPVLPDVVRRFTADPVSVSEYYGWFIGVYAVMQFFVAPILGSLSDRFGRKIVLLVSLLGAAADPALALCRTGDLGLDGREHDGRLGLHGRHQHR